MTFSYKKSLAAALILLSILIFFQKKHSSLKKNQTNADSKKSQPNTLKPQDSTGKTSNTPPSHQEQDLDSKKSLLSQEFKTQALAIMELEKQLPLSRQSLLAKILEPPTSEEIAPAHSVSEIEQNNAGALKVLALKALAQQEDPLKAQEDLEIVISKAKDPAIQSLAQEVLEAHKEGRDYFEDFSEGIDSSPL